MSIQVPKNALSRTLTLSARKQFSLRTMFVVVTVFAIFLGWLGWKLSFIRQRRDFLATMYQNIEADGFTDVFIFDHYTQPRSSTTRYLFWRRWLDDKTREQIWVWSDSTETDLERARELFPEAQVGQRIKQVIRFPAESKKPLVEATLAMVRANSDPGSDRRGAIAISPDQDRADRHPETSRQ